VDRLDSEDPAALISLLEERKTSKDGDARKHRKSRQKGGVKNKFGRKRKEKVKKKKGGPLIRLGQQDSS